MAIWEVVEVLKREWGFSLPRLSFYSDSRVAISWVNGNSSPPWSLTCQISVGYYGLNGVCSGNFVRSYLQRIICSSGFFGQERFRGECGFGGVGVTCGVVFFFSPVVCLVCLAIGP